MYTFSFGKHIPQHILVTAYILHQCTALAPILNLSVHCTAVVRVQRAEKQESCLFTVNQMTMAFGLHISSSDVNFSPKHKLPNTIACTAALTLHNSTAGGHSQQDKEKDTLGHHPGWSFGDKGITVYCGFHSD